MRRWKVDKKEIRVLGRRMDVCELIRAYGKLWDRDRYLWFMEYGNLEGYNG